MEKGYIIIGPLGVKHYYTFRQKRKDCIYAFMAHRSEQAFQIYYRLGYRVVKAQIREGWE
jgi:hypothetical protein